MKYLQRYLSLLFALVMCVGMFSITAHADNSPSYVMDLTYRLFSGSTDTTYTSMTYSNVVSGSSYYKESSEVYGISLTSDLRARFHATIGTSDGSLILKKGENFDFDMTGISLFLQMDNINYPWKIKPYYLQIVLIHTDGSFTYLNDGVEWVYSSGNLTHNIKITGTAPKDVRKIQVIEIAKVIDQVGDIIFKDKGTQIIMGDEADPTHISVEIDSKEVGLLGGILDKLTSGFKALGDGITNVVNGILELPQKLWNLISDGLKSLFVPSEDSMTAYKDKWDELLASRFGAVYQVVNIITDSWDGIMQADQTDTIEFPQATINFSGTPFTFGGYNVKIVPDGFSVLVTAIKSIVAIVCTVAFVNGMRKRYDEIMGVEQ